MQAQQSGFGQWVLGIDISKVKFDVALLNKQGKCKNRVFDNTEAGFKELDQWLKKQSVDSMHACMEATGAYWQALAEHLVDGGYEVSVVNPAQIKAYGKSIAVRTKTDAVDARVIAQYCAREQPALWHAPSPSMRTLRALVLRRQALDVMRSQELNRLEVAHSAVRPSIQSVIVSLEAQMREIERQIRELIDHDPDLRRKAELLDSVPGLGDKTIPALLSFLDEPIQRMQHANQAAAFAGLSVREHRSGSSVRAKPCLSKTGHSALRKALYMPAVVAMTRTRWGKLFAARLRANGKIAMVIIGALMRKLVHITYGILKSGKPFDASLHATS